MALPLHCDDSQSKNGPAGTPGAIFQRSCVGTARRVSPFEEIFEKDWGGSDWTRLILECHSKSEPGAHRIAEDADDNFNVPTSLAPLAFSNESWNNS